MSIVTRGLSRPDALMTSYGLGVGSSVVVICPIDQLVDVLQIFQSVGVSERELMITLIGQNEDVAVVEYSVDDEAQSPVQISAVIDRFISVSLEEVDMSIEVLEIKQTSGITEIIQTASLDAPRVTIQVVEIPEDITVKDAIDKIQ